MQFQKKIIFTVLKLCVVLYMLNLLHSCSISGENEGVIEYDIEFNEEERKKNEIIDLLPKTMKYYFKNNSAISEISYMGVFRTAYISNFDEKTNTILFYFMPNKYYCTTAFGEKTIGYDPMPGIKLEETGESKDIKGIKAYRVRVTFEDKSIDPYDVWYTKDFKVHNPNWHTPYKDINGVLLDYRIKMKGISMHMTVSSFADEAVDSAKFQIQKSYKKVNPNEMDKIFDKHLNMF
ncbi:MAG: hypothetical protein BWY22_00009 [Bacteroidetes bacterium ADurb.Bin217]|nr:MAG: hypothetical protein BWY22_00009 [Bacteroidetes bacterium ADurb.Bin217]